MKEVVLNNGIGMPVLGFSVCNGKTPYDPGECEARVLNAIGGGYRMLDIETTDSEIAVGRAIKNSGVSRDSLFIVVRPPAEISKCESVESLLSASLKRLGLAYIDMYLLDRDCDNRIGTWKTMAKLCQQGKARTIGVSNFQATDILELVARSGITPAINQVNINSCNHEKKMQVRSCNQPLKFDDSGIEFFGYSISVSLNLVNQ